MNVVITGYTGFLGKNILEYFQYFDNTNFLLIDRDYNKIKDIKKFKPDYIFHFGAEIYDYTKMFSANIEFTYLLLEEIKDIDFKLFVNCGSSSEYGNKIKPMSEHDVIIPQNLYDATKSSATLLSTAFAKMYNKPIITIRPFSVYGKYEKEHRFIPTIFRKFFNNEEITIYDGVHDFIHINDFINSIDLILKSNNTIGDIINIGTGIQHSNMYVYDTMCNIFSYTIPIIHYNYKLKNTDSDVWVSDTSYCINKYNFSPKYNLYEGLMLEYARRSNT